MKQFATSDEALEFAIQREQEAHDWYMNLAAVVQRSGMRGVFEQFAGEELGHKARLEGIKRDRSLLPAETRVADLKIGDYLVEEEPTADMTYQSALILAMKKEKAAFKLYSDLAASIQDAGLRSMFQVLAQEEAKHKLRFETEYDDTVMKDN